MISSGQTIVYERTAEAFPSVDIRATPALYRVQALFCDMTVWKLSNGGEETRDRPTGLVTNDHRG